MIATCRRGDGPASGPDKKSRPGISRVSHRRGTGNEIEPFDAGAHAQIVSVDSVAEPDLPLGLLDDPSAESRMLMHIL